MALKAKEREAQQEERRKQLPGGQIPAKEWFQPDPQEGPEIVRFTRIPPVAEVFAAVEKSLRHEGI